MLFNKLTVHSVTLTVSVPDPAARAQSFLSSVSPLALPPRVVDRVWPLIELWHLCKPDS